MFLEEHNRLIYRYDAEQLWIEPWGVNALRIRATKTSSMPTEDWALDTSPESCKPTISITEREAKITNGRIVAIISKYGKLMILNSTGKLLLEEYARNRRDVTDPKCSALEIEAREFKPIPGGNYHLTMRFESTDPKEKIFGMGQYQQDSLDLKGHDLELAQRNSQASVPFALSSLGYGLLWNNPAIGRAVFGKNITSFEAYETRGLDYWVVAGDSPREIEETYANVTGKVPMMPEYGLGFWQCKLRYQTQEELLGVAREYKARGLPIDLIVIDFFHWPKQGDWKFDKDYWPDPDAMTKQLKSLNIELMVSIWPTVDTRSENYLQMFEQGLLIRTDRGIRIGMDFMGNTIHYDATNPAARTFLWNTVKKNYYDKGIKVFWLDEAEPEYSVYDFDNYRYHLGNNLSIGNVYPRDYARGFYEGMDAAGQKNIVNLVRCAWAGSQKFGALVWSGDIASSWGSLRNQLAAGLNMGISGIPWWTTDIGGFHGGDPTSFAFRELFVRWFQYGTFCPVMRLHGDREPKQAQVGTTGGAACLSGAPNEVWSYGEEVYSICKKFMFVRDGMRHYIRETMRQAHEKGSPVMRCLWYEFPDDEACWEVEDQFMFGSSFLVAPVLEAGVRERKVYLPKGARWKINGEVFEGGRMVVVAAPLDQIPVFIRGVDPGHDFGFNEDLLYRSIS